MIVSFSISNFRSFLGEETFSLAASNRIAGKEDHVVAIPDSGEKLLRAAVVYGANGAGKSNLFKALKYLKSVALELRKNGTGTGREAFRFGGTPGDLTAFDLQFVADETLYRFGIKVDDRRIREEWLARVVGGREKVLYERVTAESGEVEIEGPGLTGTKLRALATVFGLPNKSFLATVQATLAPADFGTELSTVIEWFKVGLCLIGPEDAPSSLGLSLARSEDLRGFAGEFLKSASTGVESLEVVRDEVSQDEWDGLALRRRVAGGGDLDGGEDGFPLIGMEDGGALLAERDANHPGKHRFYRIKIQAAHEGSEGGLVPLEFTEESDGTKRLLHLIPALHGLQTGGGVYVIDEIDRSLHPMLVRGFVESFLKQGGGNRRQLIMTTHESSLLDQDLLRRDEIWFAEKDREGATHLYSLMDFKVRNDLEIRKHYLQGRFGAVPFLGDLARLPGERDHAA